MPKNDSLFDVVLEAALKTRFTKLDKANPELLLESVAIVNARMEANRQFPGAERWQGDSRKYRPRLIAWICEEWERLAKCDEVFPWHDDYVIEVFVSFRKLPKEKKDEWFEHFDISASAYKAEETGDVEKPDSHPV